MNEERLLGGQLGNLLHIYSRNNKTFWIGLAFVIALYFLIGRYLGLMNVDTFSSWGITFSTMGTADSTLNYGFFGLSNYDILFPYGGRVVEGISSNFLMHIFLMLGLSTSNALVATGLLLYSVSFASLLALSFLISRNIFISLCAICVYFVSPFLLSQSGIPLLYFSILLIPLMGLIDYFLYQKIYVDSKREKYKKWHFLVLIPIIFLRIFFSLFSWYSTVIYACASCLFFLLVCFEKMIRNIKKTRSDKKENAQTGIDESVEPPKKRVVLPLLGTYIAYSIMPWIIAMLVALYNTPLSSATSSALEFYNGTSVDMAMLLMPVWERLVWFLPSLLPYVPDGFRFYGDITQIYVYLGISTTVLVGVLLLKKNYRDKNIVILIIVFVLFLCFSLGPGFKFMQLLQENPGAYSQYLLPLENTVQTPWAFLYELFPVSSMRAVYRWFIVPNFLICIFYLLFSKKFLTLTEGKWKSPLLLGISLLFLIDFLPATVFARVVDNGHDKQTQLYETQEALIDPLQALAIPENSMIAFADYGTWINGYLTPYIVSELDVRTYNGAGDKDILNARPYYPKNIDRLTYAKSGEEILALASEMEAQGILDYLLLPHFSLNHSSRGEVIYDIGFVRIAHEVREEAPPEWNITKLDYYTVIQLNPKTIEYQDSQVYENIQNRTHTLNPEEPLAYQVVSDLPASDTFYNYLYVENNGEPTTLKVEATYLDAGNNEIGAQAFEYTLTAGSHALEEEWEVPQGTTVAEVAIHVENPVQVGAHFSSLYSSEDVFRSENQRQISELLAPAVWETSYNVTVVDDELVFGEDANLHVENDFEHSSFLHCQFDIFLEDYEDNSILIGKLLAWEDQMTFMISVNDGKMGILLSDDGTNSNGIWIDMEEIPLNQWNELEISFDTGLLTVHLNGKEYSSQLSLTSLYASDLPIVFESFVGKVRNLQISTFNTPFLLTGASEFDFTQPLSIEDKERLRGIYLPDDPQEASFTSDFVQISLSKDVSEIVINGYIPDYLEENIASNTLHIYANSNFVQSVTLLENEEFEITADLSAYLIEDENTLIEIVSDYTYNPSELGLGEDERDLAYVIYYVGTESRRSE